MQLQPLLDVYTCERGMRSYNANLIEKWDGQKLEKGIVYNRTGEENKITNPFANWIFAVNRFCADVAGSFLLYIFLAP